MIIIRGVNVFPSQVEAVLLDIEGVEPHFQIVLDRKGALDEMEVQIEVEPVLLPRRRAAAGGVRAPRGGAAAGRSWASGRGCKLVEPKTIPRHTGKARRVIDRRR